jgi:hypothetical protein
MPRLLLFLLIGLLLLSGCQAWEFDGKGANLSTCDEVVRLERKQAQWPTFGLTVLVPTFICERHNIEHHGQSCRYAQRTADGERCLRGYYYTKNIDIDHQTLLQRDADVARILSKYGVKP